MPALTSYTTYEELVFFQNVAEQGATTPSLQAIANTLTQDQLIRESETFDASKFTPDALRRLYESAINDKAPTPAANAINGSQIAVGTATSDDAKRNSSLKLNSTQAHAADARVGQFIDKLYAQFKEHTIRELRRQEGEYQRLQAEINNLEAKVKIQPPVTQSQTAQSPNPVTSLNGNRSQAAAAAATISATVSAKNATNTTAGAGNGSVKGLVPNSNVTPAAAPVRPQLQQQRPAGNVQAQPEVKAHSKAQSQPKLQPASHAQSQAEAADPVAAQLQADLDAANNDTTASSPAKHLAAAKQTPTISKSTGTPQPSQNGQLQPSTGPRQSAITNTPTARRAQIPVSQQPIQPQPQPPANTLQSPLAPQSTPLPGVSQPLPAQDVQQPQPKASQPSNAQNVSQKGTGVQQRASDSGRASPMPQHSTQAHASILPHQQAANTNRLHQAQPSRHQNVTQQIPSQQSQPALGTQTSDLSQHHPQYTYAAPIPKKPHAQRQGSPSTLQQRPSVSASTTPIPRPSSRASLPGSGASTPWKKATPTKVRTRSPSRLEREVSPLSDSELVSPISPRRRGRPHKGDTSVAKKQPLSDQSNHVMLAPNASRAQSVISTTSDAQDPPRRRAGRPPKAKADPPGTPVAHTSTGSDSEQPQRSSSRRGRSRGGISVGTNDTPATVVPSTNKRKRDASSVSPAPRARPAAKRSTMPSSPDIVVDDEPAQSANANLILVSKTFGRTSQLLLNEISSHKLGGIFAKPLSERDAPGYKSQVLRPQDLKTIKAAITKGSRAAVAAIEELEVKETGDEDHDSDEAEGEAKVRVVNSSDPGPIGNGYYLVEVTDDITPPKGIVNFEQLEMELVRMFANAVMFNPLPSTERGFGRSLRLRKRGGEPRFSGPKHYPNREPAAEDREASAESTGNSTTETDTSESVGEDGGIISDAREMFKDVEQLVARWRALEGEKIGGTATQQLSSASGNERGVSVSASSAAGEDMEEGTPAASTIGSVRKRRRVGDH